MSERSFFGLLSKAYARRYTLARAHAVPIDLTLSNPTRAGLSLPDFTAELATSAYSPEPQGALSARAALAQLYQPRAVLSADDFVLTASTSESYNLLLHVLCDPGDAILVPQPGYPLFAQLAKLAGVRLIPYRIRYDGAFHIDVSTLPSTDAAANLKLRAIFVVSPNNPTGNSVSELELTRLREFGLPLIVDEVFREYVHLPRRENAEILADCRGLTVFLDGLSKRAGAPGLKLGWIGIVGDNAHALKERLLWASDAFLSVSAQVQEGAARIIARAGEAHSLIQTRVQTNRALLERTMQSTPVTCLSVEAGWTALLRLPSTRTEEEWWDALCEQGVWAHPGELYELGIAPVLAVSLLTEKRFLEEGLARLLRVVMAEATASATSARE